MEAVRVPVAVGLKVTLMVQFAPAARPVPQVLVCAKSPLFVPLSAIELMESAKLPLFVSVTVCAALTVPMAGLVKVRLAGFKLAAGAGGGVTVNTCAAIEPIKT